MPLRVQDRDSRFQHSVGNSWPIKWNAVIEREKYLILILNFFHQMWIFVTLSYDVKHF